MKTSRFKLAPYQITLGEGEKTWQAPSNIALVKYWGKYGEQLPKNASISFTLKNCFTRTTISYKPKESEGFVFEVFRDQKHEPGFEPKIQKFFERILPYLPFLDKYAFRIDTHNSFPHSSGIASSASGMSALALCLMSMEEEMTPMNAEFFLEKASFLARLGSGSASRSIEGPLVVWGAHKEIENSSNEIAVRYPYEVHENFKNYRDTILLVDKGEKQVSSTVGHNLMHDHPFAEERFKQANAHMSDMIRILKEGDLNRFIQVVEREALSLHAMMLTSMPYFILMKPNTLEIINEIWAYREATGSAICFTLDAGANVHVLYPDNERAEVELFIKNKLAQFCKNGEFINDVVGIGAFAL